jgi:2-dehydro-3-deoxyphosphooctonate aldolase (KDO 8-P synthase)
MGTFTLIAGPCAVEEKEVCEVIAQKLVELRDKYDFELIFKGSYKKANRTKLDSFTTIGEEKALKILEEIGYKYDVLTITDVHESHEPALVAPYVDYLQIPAFLCRQTDLLIAAGKTGLGVNIKKGQFLGPEMMEHAADKVRRGYFLKTGEDNAEILLTERGSTFGYNYLVTDMTSFPKMNPFGTTIMDCTHSVQIPNQSTGITGGDSRMIGTIAKAAIAAGAQGLFIEVHPEPSKASSDAGSILKLDLLEEIISDTTKIWKALHQ